MQAVVRYIFFGNLFYGICAVGLAVEASLQQQLPLPGPLYYLLIFLVTVLYYNVAYITEKPSGAPNPRTDWYYKNRLMIRNIHRLLSVLFVIAFSVFLYRYGDDILRLPGYLWLVLLIFPLTGGLYYGINHRAVGRFNLRDFGWLKPFIIGFSWAGLVTISPVIHYCLQTGSPYPVTLLGTLLFIKNFMFVSLLCILFDIKDYATDYNQRLKTLVVDIGLRRTIFYMIIPLTILGLGSFLTYGLTHSFSPEKILLNTAPFLLLIAVAYSLHRRRSIFYYLVIIDGLMLVKALCGSLAMLFF